MGAGDFLMAAGEARAVHAKTGKDVVIVDRHNRAQWLDLWNGIPYILPRYEQGAVRIVNGPGVRPYILAKLATRWKWKKYSPKPAEVRLTLDEQRFAEPFRGMVMIEPNVKDIGHTNKAWIPQRWVDLAEALNEPLVQCVPSIAIPSMLPKKVLKAVTPTFRHAMAVLSVCRTFVGTEGGLGHAAAAVGVPSVIIFGGFISPAVTGYAMHSNLFAGTDLGCGNRLNCSHCRKCMEQITVEEVLGAVKDVLQRQAIRS
jgi:hypothetical protein